LSFGLVKSFSFFQTYSVINQRDIDIFVLSPLSNALKGQIIPTQGNALGLSTLYAFAL